MSADIVYASCVCINGKGVLLLGASGSGKSDLALRLIDGGAALVADDQVQVRPVNDRLTASAPDALRGLIEARGAGILTLPNIGAAPLTLAVQLVARSEVERLPDAAFWSCHGLQVPLLSLHAFDESTPAKIRLFMSAL